jgi:8-oxo-dGTP diphosphatase
MQQLLVTAGVIVRNGLIMMAQRHVRDFEGNKWEFPGGKVEPGEEPRHGLQRELREELGITVQVGRIIDLGSQVVGERHLVLLYFHCELEQGEPAPLDCQQVRWLSPVEVDRLSKPLLDQAFWEQHCREIFLL